MKHRFLSAAAACLLLACTTATAAPPLAPDQLAEIDRYLGHYMRDVVVTRKVQQPDGDEISCVDMHHQPAINNPHFSGTIDQPSPELIALIGGTVTEAEPSKICPPGSLEMMLPTREQIVRRGGLKKFLAKHPDGKARMPSGDSPYHVSSTPEPPLATGIGHRHAVVKSLVSAYGAQATINVWRPTVNAGDFSLTQIWVIGGEWPALQTVEVGMQVFPSQYLYKEPILFIYYTPDGYTTGCYNLYCPAFVQTSNALPIGRRIDWSTLGGRQVERTLRWQRDPRWGHWYLFVKNSDGSLTAAGYYPWGLFKGGPLSNYARSVEFGGEIYVASGTNSPTVPMGSANNPRSYAGSQLYGLVAYQRNLQYMDTSQVWRDFTGFEASIVPSNGCAYSPRFNPSSTPPYPGWGSTVWFGGAGFVGTCQ